MNLYEEESCTFARGFLAAGVACGIKKASVLDLGLLVSETPASASGVFTQNAVRAACIDWNIRALQDSRSEMRAVVINSGNANAVTGNVGVRDNAFIATETSRLLGCRSHQVLVGSTGVIGVPLPMLSLSAGIRGAHAALDSDGGKFAARAIMTTDTQPKHLGLESPEGYRIGGMAKGAGMIHPNMATLISVICTDALISPHSLDSITRTVAGKTFNCISIDGDTSTNDMFLVLANGQSGIEPNLQEFEEQLRFVALNLSRKIVEDAEGATKFVEIEISGARNEPEATAVARTISTSMLVKTAIFGSDPNWGRVLAAAGRAGVPLNVSKISLSFGGIEVLKEGEVLDFDESRARETFQNRHFRIRLDLGMGEATSCAFTSDLSHEYVTINSAYRT
jgi:glutamate N-acetyltransferase/amino-acid N-acetyltransferase